MNKQKHIAKAASASQIRKTLNISDEDIKKAKQAIFRVTGLIIKDLDKKD